MATIVVDELVTKLSYDTASVKDVKAAEKAVDQLDKANKQTAKSTDVLSQEQLELSEQLNRTATRSAKLRAQKAKLTETIRKNGKATQAQERWLKKLNKELRAVGKEERELRATGRELSTQKQRLGQESRKLARDQQRLAKATRQATARMRQQERAEEKLVAAKVAQRRANREELRGLGKETATAAGGAASTIGGLFTAATAGTLALGKSVIETGTSFESLRAQLKTVEGSTQGANAAFALVQDFASKTPFQVDNLTSAFVSLRVRGVQPNQESLTSLGDLASAFGQEFGEVTDAIGAAARGELDPIEKFGISAKIAGDQIKLSFKGQTVEVERNAEAVTNALVAFGKMEGVQGAMAEQSATTGGKLSNLQDTISGMLDRIAQAGPLEEFKLLLADLSMAAGDEGLARVIAEGLTEAIHMAREAIGDLTAEDIAGFFDTMIGGAQTAVEAAQALISVFQWLTKVTGDTGSALQAMTLLAVGLTTAMTGPAGIVVAAGLVGVALGQMAANGIGAITGLNDEIAATEARISTLQKSIAESNKAIAESERGFAEAEKKIVEAEAQRQKKLAAKLERQAGGLGAGLVRELDKEEAGFQAQFIEQGDAEAVAAAQEKLFTEEGRVVAAAVKGAEEKKVAQVEKRARKEARKRGASEAEVEAAGQRARQGAEAAATKNRRQAFETAQKTFAETGSVEAATLAGVRQVEGRGKKGAAKKGKKAAAEGLLTEDVEKQIEDLAKQAGKREAARALAGGASAAEANRREREQRRSVKTRLETRFQETGELPAGISQDLAQISALPNVEQVGGRLAPPVITINNQRIEITGNQFEAIVQVAGTSATPQEVANAVVARALPVTHQDLALALQNNITTLRR